MKKILITVLIAILVGSLFAYLLYKNTDEDITLAVGSNATITLFQCGVFKNEDNANLFMQNYSSSIIIEDNQYYRVVIAILKTDEAIALEEEYFTNLNIDYYLKQVTISDEEFLTKLAEYEQVLINSSTDTYNTINKNILKLYEEIDNS